MEGGKGGAIRTALAADLPGLGALALRAKAYWGYPAAMLEAMRAELSWSPSDLARVRLRLAETADGEAIGFSGLVPLSAREFELEALFVDPPWIGTGWGRRLLADALARACEQGAERLLIQSDPDAQAFYRHLGARRIGMRPSGSIAGRELPLLELDLRGGAA